MANLIHIQNSFSGGWFDIYAAPSGTVPKVVLNSITYSNTVNSSTSVSLYVYDEDNNFKFGWQFYIDVNGFFRNGLYVDKNGNEHITNNDMLVSSSENDYAIYFFKNTTNSGAEKKLGAIPAFFFLNEGDKISVNSSDVTYPVLLDLLVVEEDKK